MSQRCLQHLNTLEDSYQLTVVDNSPSEDSDDSFTQTVKLQQQILESGAATLTLESSVYDNVLVAPLLAEVEEDFADAMNESKTCSAIIMRSWAFLLLTFALQAIVIWQVRSISLKEEDEQTNLLLGSADGLCRQVVIKDECNATHRTPVCEYVNNSLEYVIICGSHELFLMYNESLFEDYHLYNNLTSPKDLMDHPIPKQFCSTCDVVNIPEMHRRIIRQFEKGKFTVDKWTANNGSSSSLNSSFMKTEIMPSLDACGLDDWLLCGNLVQEGSWTPHEASLTYSNASLFRKWYSEDNEPGAQSTCATTLKRLCKHYFSNNYDIARHQKERTCGNVQITHKSVLDHWKKGNLTVSLAQYQAAESPTDGMKTDFVVFLFLILCLWTFAMLKEFHSLLVWWSVVPWFQSGGSWKYEGGEVTILGLPSCHKILVVFLVLIPRTILAFFILRVGTLYLLSASHRMDLVMNALALTYLIEVDDMIFFALVPPIRKKFVSKCRPLLLKEKQLSCLHSVLVNIPLDIILLALVSVYVVDKMQQEYGGPFTLLHGEHERQTASSARSLVANVYDCLCHSHGPHCLSSIMRKNQTLVRGNL